VIRRALVLTLFSAALQAQAPPTIVHGRIVAADTGDPIRNARVGTADGPDAPAALSDAEGRFALAGVPADQREISVAKTGYLSMTVPTVADLEIRLTKGGVITGRVLDDLGDPEALMNVAAFRVRRTGRRVTFERFRATETDDLGEYRLFDLPPGEFVVAAAPGRVGTATTTIPVSLDRIVFRNYYPHAETPETGQRIMVRSGEETPGIDLTEPLPPFGPLLTSSGPSPAAPLPAPRPGGTGAIRGRVMGSDGLPIRRARVQLISGEQLFSPYFVPTDDEGRYEFAGLKAGSYLVTAGRLDRGQVPFSASAGARGPDLLTLAAGATLAQIDITIPRGGVISGRILDEFGDPMANANIRVEAVVFVRGRRRLVPVPGIASRQTNDLGRYRIFGLPPGRYVVGAVVGETVPGWHTADWPGYARTYFPGSAVPAEAQTVDLAPSQQALTIDFALVRGGIARIAGRATLSDGAPLQGVMSLTQSFRSGAIATPPVLVRTEADGSFVFARVAPGEYVLQAATSRATVSTEGEFAAQYISVNGVDLTGLAVHLSAGSTIEGRLSFDGGDPPEDPDFHLSPVPGDPDLTSLADNAPARADIHDDWTFEMSGITGPRRLQLTQAPDGWALKMVRVNGVDATDALLMFGTAEQSLRDVEVVVTNHVTELTVTDAAAGSASAADFRVIAFATDRARRYEGTRYAALGVPGPRGAVVLRGLPPGDYYVVAMGRGAQPDTSGSDPQEFLASLAASATKVTLTEGEHRSLRLRVIGR